MVILGVVVVVLGLAGLGYCVRQGFVIRRAGLPPATANARLQRLVAVNLGSVALAALGLALVVIGLAL
jgi:hypothetical protein